MEELIRTVLDKNPEAIAMAKKEGRASSPALASLAKNEDPEVREIALYCLDEIGGLEALQTFVESLMDKEDLVKSAAIQALHNHPESSVYGGLLQAYDRSPDPYVRQQIPLILGRMGKDINMNDLQPRFRKEKDTTSIEGWIVALARLGEKNAQQEFAKRLQASSQQNRLRYIEYCEYIHAPWLLKPMLPLLDDKSPMINMRIDSRPEDIENLRACDLAVNLVASISGHKFSFPISETVNYGDDGLEEVKTYLRGLH